MIINIGGSGIFDSGLALPGNAGYTNLDFSAGSIGGWNVGAAALMRLTFGSIGAGAMKARLSPSVGPATNVMSYGAFGEFFVTEDLTFSAKAGMFDGTGAFDGEYFGFGAKFYPIQNWSLGLRADRTQFKTGGDLTDYGATAEYLVNWDIPISILGGYTYSETSTPGPHLNLWTIGLKFYFGGSNDALKTHYRSGAVDSPYMPLKSVLAL